MVAASLALGVLLSGCGSSSGTLARTTELDGDSLVSVEMIELPFAVCNQPQLVGTDIYATIAPGEDDGMSLVRYDTRTKAVETIVKVPEPSMIGYFVANERWLVYSVGFELFAQSLETGERQVACDNHDLYGPTLNGDLLAWTDLTPERTHEIVIRDLAKRETTVVAPLAMGNLYNNFSTWDGDRLVWTDIVNDVGRYRTFDVATKELQEFDLSGIEYRYPGYVQADGDRFYSINFNDVAEWDWATQRVGYLSRSQGRFVPIVPEGFIANSIRATDGIVAIVDLNQRMTIRSTSEPEGQTREYQPVEGRIDALQVSSDGTLIAWRDSLDPKGRCTLFLIRAR